MRSAGPTRRGLLLGTLGTAALPALGALSGCGDGGQPGPSPTPSAARTVAVTPGNPFGVVPGSGVEVLVGDERPGTKYLKVLADRLTSLEARPSLKIQSAPAGVGEALLTGQRPLPDLVDLAGNEGPALAGPLPDLTDLDEVLTSARGATTPSTSGPMPQSLAEGRWEDHQYAIPYARCVHGLWYSERLFRHEGWVCPRTWSQALTLGLAARRRGMHLFSWSRFDAHHNLDLVISSAVREGGTRVLEAFDSLSVRAWQQRPVQDSLAGLKGLVDAGLVRPDGATATASEALAHWATDGEVLLRPDGAWLAGQLASATAEDFSPALCPGLAVSLRPTLGRAAVQVTSEVWLAAPQESRNPAGAKEVLRALLSPDAAADFTRTTLVPTVVAGSLPEDSSREPALAEQLRVLDEAGSSTFSWGFVRRFGLGADHRVLTSAFLDGQLDVETMTSELQALVDRARQDPELRKPSP